MELVPWATHFCLLLLRTTSFISVFTSLRQLLGVAGTTALASGLALWLAGAATANSSRAVVEYSMVTYSLMCVREILIGVLLAFPLAIAVEMLVGIGRVIDVTRGAQFSEQFNPALGTRASTLEGLMPLVFALLIFSPAGVHFGAQLLLRSLELDVAFSFDGYILPLIRVSAMALRDSVIFCAPLLVMALVVDVALAVLSRFVGRLNVTFELVPLKLVGVLFLAGLLFAERDFSSALRPARALSSIVLEKSRPPLQPQQLQP